MYGRKIRVAEAPLQPVPHVAVVMPQVYQIPQPPPPDPPVQPRIESPQEKELRLAAAYFQLPDDVQARVKKLRFEPTRWHMAWTKRFTVIATRLDDDDESTVDDNILEILNSSHFEWASPSELFRTKEVSNLAMEIMTYAFNVSVCCNWYLRPGDNMSGISLNFTKTHATSTIHFNDFVFGVVVDRLTIQMTDRIFLERLTSMLHKAQIVCVHLCFKGTPLQVENAGKITDVLMLMADHCADWMLKLSIIAPIPYPNINFQQLDSILLGPNNVLRHIKLNGMNGLPQSEAWMTKLIHHMFASGRLPWVLQLKKVRFNLDLLTSFLRSFVMGRVARPKRLLRHRGPFVERTSGNVVKPDFDAVAVRRASHEHAYSLRRPSFIIIIDSCHDINSDVMWHEILNKVYDKSLIGDARSISYTTNIFGPPEKYSHHDVLNRVHDDSYSSVHIYYRDQRRY